MKSKRLVAFIVMLAAFACTKPAQDDAPTNASPEEGQSSVQDDESQKNIVQTAISSPDHKTLVAALKAASYVDALSNAGPFTVFAPNDQGFAKLPEGTVEDLVKP